MAVATVLGLAVRIITVGPVVSLVLLVLCMDSDDVFHACLYTDLLDCERCVPLKDCWIDRCERCTLRILWLGRW